MPPKPSDAAERMVSMSYKDYLDGQNEVVLAINNHCSVAQGIIGTFSMSMATMRGALLKTRESIRSVSGGVDSVTETMERYPALVQLLAKEPHDITNMLSVPTLSGLPATVAAGPPGKKKRRKREQKPKDPNAPKRPNTAFFLFLEATRPVVRKALGDGAKPGEIAAEQRVRWKDLPESDKELYKAQYQANFKEYQAEVVDYKAKGGHIEDADLQPVEDDAEVPHEDVAEASDDSDESSEEEDEEEEPAPPPPPPAKKGRKAAAAAAPVKDDISSKIDPRLTESTPQQKSPEKEKKPRGKAAQAAAAAAAAAANAAAAVVEESPEKPKAGRPKKQAKAASPEETRKRKGAAVAPAASTPAPASAAAAAPVLESDTAASARKKRKSTGSELEERKKKRKETLGEDY